MAYWFDMFWAFFCIGGLTFGGGYAMLPMLEQEIVTRRKWATSDELLDYYAVGQCTPGVIAVNVATMIGFKQKRYLGAALCTFGVVAPSLIIIMAIAGILNLVAGNEIVAHAFGGIRVAVCALVLSAVIKLFKSGVKDNMGRIIFVLSFAAVALFGLSPIIIVIFAAVLGVISARAAAKEVK